MSFELSCVDLHVFLKGLRRAGSRVQAELSAWRLRDPHIIRLKEGSIGFGTRANAASCLTGQDLGYSMAASKHWEPRQKAAAGGTMKRSGVLLLCLCLLGAAGCSDDGPTNPSNLPIVMTASLSPSNEVPAIASPENTGFGNVQITFNVTRDSTGAITAGTADFLFQLTGFPSSTTIIAAHIHPGAAGVNGGVIVSTGIVAANPVTQTNGVMTFSVSNVAVPTATLQSIVNNPAGFYFNVHSPTNPGGVARGQLNRAL
jgi:hypothetical protein